MSSRAGLRFYHAIRHRCYQTAKPIGRRFQVTDAATAASESYAQRLWNSPVGVKTVHFWAPVMKWAIVLTGVSDFWRPVEKLSLTQNAALTTTGMIWTRWCFIIKPKNVLLATVNFFLACVGAVQVTRILLYQQNLKNGSLPQALEADVVVETESAKSIASKAKEEVSAAVR